MLIHFKYEDLELGPRHEPQLQLFLLACVCGVALVVGGCARFNRVLEEADDHGWCRPHILIGVMEEGLGLGGLDGLLRLRTRPTTLLTLLLPLHVLDGDGQQEVEAVVQILQLLAVDGLHLICLGIEVDRVRLRLVREASRTPLSRASILLTLLMDVEVVQSRGAALLDHFIRLWRVFVLLSGI